MDKKSMKKQRLVKQIIVSFCMVVLFVSISACGDTGGVHSDPPTKSSNWDNFDWDHANWG